MCGMEKAHEARPRGDGGPEEEGGGELETQEILVAGLHHHLLGVDLQEEACACVWVGVYVGMWGERREKTVLQIHT